MGAPTHAQQPEGIGIRLLEAPTDRRDDPRARRYIVDHVSPGARLSRGVEVSNGTGRPVRLQLYAAAATISAGRFEVADGRTGNDLTSWISVAPAAVDLAPGQRATARVTIAVDPRASAGERYAAVLAELPAGRGSGGEVTIASRVGVRVYLSVGPGGEPRSDFTIRSLAGARDLSGRPFVAAQVTNTGQRALDLSGTLALRDEGRGFAFGPFPARLGTTLGIGQSSNVVVPLDPETPRGGYDARLTLRSGTTERAAEAHVVLPERAGSSSSPVPARPVTTDARRSVALVVAILLLLAVGIGLAALATSRWLRRRAGGQGEPVA